jgi:TatD DNase family protein
VLQAVAGRQFDFSSAAAAVEVRAESPETVKWPDLNPFGECAVNALVDTHAHLDDDRLAPDLPAVLERARAAGVTRTLTVGIDRESNRLAVRYAAEHPDVFAIVGIHPNNVAAATPADFDEMEHLAATAPKVVAVGESGLDRYRDRTPFEMQEAAFIRHLALGRRLNKPVVIHCRDADADVVRVLRADFAAHGPVPAITHSFCGDAATAAACVELGLYFSLSGMLTFKANDALRAVVREIPLDRLLVETDCPYLAPQPVRGKRNEPAYVAHTAATLAQVKGVSVEEIAEITTRNAVRLFGLT